MAIVSFRYILPRRSSMKTRHRAQTHYRVRIA